MRYFYDTEFLDDGKTIDLVSIGIVCEDGREYYAQSVEFEPKNANPWVKENVFPHLTLHPMDKPFESHSTPYDLLIIDWAFHETIKGQCRTGYTDPLCPWRTREQIRDEIKYFFNPSDGIQLWGYYSSYDHVAFCQLFGAMADLPKGYPMLTYDLRQLLDTNHLFDIRQPDDSPHNSLEDARWIAETYRSLL
jgi:hypothetical protein